MKFIFLTGGIVGFAVAAVAGYSAGRSPDNILLSAAVGCLAGAFLFRWYWNVWLRGIRDSCRARQRAAAAAPAPATGAKPSKP